MGKRLNYEKALGSGYCGFQISLPNNLMNTGGEYREDTEYLRRIAADRLLAEALAASPSKPRLRRGLTSKKAKVDACSDALRNNAEFGGVSDATQWYYCADDETPKDIAEKFNVDCKDLVKRNRDRLQGLQPFSNLMEG